MKPVSSIGDYLIERLVARGVRHVFGVPGDYVLSFMKKLSESPLQLINTCDEQGAGFAADAYARMTGLGVVCITYGVGGLKIANTTAQAYAEESPVLIISGTPGRAEKQRNAYLHHKARQYDTQLRVFEQLTVASTDLSDPQRACQEIDRVLAAIERTKRPGYIELPRDLVAAPGMPYAPSPQEADASDAAAMQEALAEAASMIRDAERPVILAGVDVQRFGLQDALVELAERTGIPVAATILSKSAMAETHPLYLGVYAGALGNEAVREYVEASDCLIMLGVYLTELDLGIFTAHLEQSRSIHATSERLAIRHHTYPQVSLKDFVAGLSSADVARPAPGAMPHPYCQGAFTPVAGQKITVRRLFEGISYFLDCNTVVLADIGDSLYGAMELMTCQRDQFMSGAYYASLGFAVPASIGAQTARPELRPLVLVGDGAFQMTGMELATVARFGLNPIVIVFNNSGYATERPMQDGPFNDILPWQYSRLPEFLGAGRGYTVETEEQLLQALLAARAYTAGYSILEVRLDVHDMSPGLQRLTSGLAKSVRG